MPGCVHSFAMRSPGSPKPQDLRRLESVRAVLEGGGEDPLENEEQLTDQMDALPFLCRFQYDRTCAYLTGLMDPLMAAYSAAASASPGAPAAPPPPRRSHASLRVPRPGGLHVAKTSDSL
jgi:hypothetical protein